MIALDADGVVGRVIETGQWSARILLLSDLNFRLPVMIEELRQQAIFKGQGRDDPELLFVSQKQDVKPGMRIVTSGHGGMFPAGLPVGIVKGMKEGEILVQPYGHLDRLEIMRLVHYSLAPQAAAEVATPAAAIPATPAAPAAAIAPASVAPAPKVP
jgi:rod shape-determining protein MreC